MILLCYFKNKTTPLLISCLPTTTPKEESNQQGGRGPCADGGMGGGKGTKSGRGGRKLGAGEFENVVEGALGGSY